LDRAVKKIWF